MREKPLRVGGIGHVDVGDIERQSFVHFCCHRLLTALKRKHGSVVAVSAMSAGADSIFAQSAVSLDIPLESIIPFGEFDTDFQQEQAIERYNSLRSKAKSETGTRFLQRSDLAYRKSMQWLVFKSDLVVAVWDGIERGSTGGTWEAVSLLRRLRKPMVHIDIQSKAMNFSINTNNEYARFRSVSVEQIVRKSGK